MSMSKIPGVGIPYGVTGQVFGRFQKLNEFAQGTGLGLAISFGQLSKAQEEK